LKRSLGIVMIVSILMGIMIFSVNVMAANTNVKTGALEGYIYRHANVWTIDDNNGWPKYNLSVYTPAEVEFVGANNVKIILVGENTYEVVTDRNGYFKFTDVLPGNYVLNTEAPNYENISIEGLQIEAGKTFNISSDAGSYIPLGSTFYLLAGIDRPTMTYYAENTVNELTTILYNKNKLAKECLVLSGAQVKKEMLKQNIEKLGQNLSFSDTVVIYFYGSTFVNQTDGKVYLDCADGNVLSKSNVNYDTLISAQDLLTWLNDSMSNKNTVVLIIEADNSAKFVEEIVNGFKGPIAAIAAASDNGEWYELEDTKHGLMSEGIIGSLSQSNPSTNTLFADISQDGMVTVPEIFMTMEGFVDSIPNINQTVQIHLNDLFRPGINFYR